MRRVRMALLFLLWLIAWSAPAIADEAYVAVRVEGVINPIKARLVERARAQAEASGARLLVVLIDTPGGLVTSMQEIVGTLTNARVPVVTYTAPRSAQATSAGAFILLAGDVAAMAPGTRVGAAHPVAQGQNLEGAMNDKATNSLASLIRSLAERRGRPAADAEAMVRESLSFTAEQAHEKKLVELLVVNEGGLLAELNGRELRGKALATRGLQRREVTLSTFDRVLDKIADPTLTSLLISLGFLGLLYELTTPGIGAGGVVGAVLLLLGLLGSSVLPVELTAVGLLVVGFVAILLEAKLPTYGVLAGAGVISIVFGGLLLVDGDDYFGGVVAVNPLIFVPVVAAAAGGLALLAAAVKRSQGAPILTGSQALLGRSGTAKSEFGREVAQPGGQVMVDGARWAAETDEATIRDGETIEVVAVSEKPTRLFVRRRT